MIDFDAELTQGAFSLTAKFRSESRVTALYGPSGAGKTTIINLIAGLSKPARGDISVGATVLTSTSRGVFVPVHQRRMGLVFQDAQLFPHMTVSQNLKFGGWFAPAGDAKVPFDAVIEALGIGALLNRRPPRLSGGEKQRVALARALLSSPRLLLLDEPLAALDEERKREILPLIERVRDEFGIPMIYVTHSADEILRLASYVIVLRNGSVVASGSATQVMARATAAAEGALPT